MEHIRIYPDFKCFDTKTTYSAHWIAHKGLSEAIDHYLERERQAVEHEAAYLEKRTPFKKDPS